MWSRSSVSSSLRRKEEAITKKWTQEETTYAVRGAVGLKAPNTTAHMRMARGFPSVVARRRIVLVDNMIHRLIIKMASQ
jgi:hypothetical protein